MDIFQNDKYTYAFNETVVGIICLISRIVIHFVALFTKQNKNV